jgi:hypothetical protein
LAEPTAPTSFGKAVAVVGEETFDISDYVVEQTASQPYRLLPSPSPEEGQGPYRVKDVILRLEGVAPHSKHFVQVPLPLLLRPSPPSLTRTDLLL